MQDNPKQLSITLYEQAEESARFIAAKCPQPIDVAVVLGSGLGAFADGLEKSVAVGYGNIPHFPVSTVVGHAGRLVIGSVGDRTVAAMQGRFHHYEGYSLEAVTFPIRVLGMLGVKRLILTNASGGINLRLRAGSLVLISDHINLMGANPLRGANEERFGSRFPDMTYMYSREWRQMAKAVAEELGLALEEGVYVAVAGPSYETPAEIRMLRMLGADVVGMSTVPEVIVARHMGMDVLGISVVANMAAGVLDQPLNHEEVLEAANDVGQTLTELLRRIVQKLPMISTK
jgi:purine-nucleoside phosphorylase